MDFENWFYSNEVISEITKQIASQIEDYFDDSDNWAFPDIFPENKTRLVYPFMAGGDTPGNGIIKKIQDLGMAIDFENGLVGSGNRKVRLGKFIMDKKSPFTAEEKEWWVKQGDAIKSLQSINNKDNFALILSRNPFDVIRMSDHDGWSSCHSPGKQYWSCAVGESKNSGGIAYLVPAEEVNKVDMDAKEIFVDAKRKVPGLSPISRLRIRKFVDKKTDQQLAIPEDRVYGKNITGFREKVRQVVKDLQKDIIKDERLRLKDFNLMGGSYEDTVASTMFNKFFDDDLDRGVADYAGEDDEHMGMAEQWDEEVQGINERYNGRFKFVYTHAEVDETDGQPFVSMSGGGQISIPKRFFIKELDIPKEWKEMREHPVYKNVKKILTDYFSYYINEIEFTHDNDDLIIVFNFDSAEDPNPDGYATFCDNLLDGDKSGEEIRQKIVLELESEGYVGRPSYMPDEMQEDIHLVDQTHFKYFGFLFDENTWDFNIKLKRPVPLFEMDVFGMEEQKFHIQGITSLSDDRVFLKQVLDTILFYMDRMERIQKQQKLLFGEHPRIAPTESFRNNFRLDDLKVGIYISEYVRKGYDRELIKRIGDLKGNYVLFDLFLEMDSLNHDKEHIEEMARIVKFMDDNFEQLRKQFEKLVLNQSSIYKR
jgi:hypothetical protein